MNKKFQLVGITLMVSGLLFCAWNVYEWWQSSQSVDAMEPKSIITKAHKEKTIQKKSVTPEQFSTHSYDYKKGKNIATLTIPAVNQTFKVFWGTGQDTLDKGVGMYVSKWTTIPNEQKGHTVLSGHRDTVFTELGHLEKDDVIIVTYEDEQFKYKIDKIWITDADDRTVIVKKDKPTLTLTTCYPFDYIGDAPNRYIIQGHLMNH